jgi:U6 snRNA-associated Sm-like protein LSm4
MNLTLREVIQTSPEGDKFWRLPECYIRGNTIKYLNVPEEIVDMVKEEEGRQRQLAARNRGRGGQNNNRGRGNNRNQNRTGGRGGSNVAK